MDNSILSLLGLCRRAGMLVCGEEPVLSAVQGKNARLVVTAADAADNTVRYSEYLAQQGACLRLSLPFTKAELGRALGCGVCALAAVTDIGFAANLAERLARTDPERYGADAERLKIKAKRAAERKAQHLAERDAAKKAARERRQTAAAPPPDSEAARRAAPQTGKASSGAQTAPRSRGERPATPPGKSENARRPAHGTPKPGQPYGKRPGAPAWRRSERPFGTSRKADGSSANGAGGKRPRPVSDRHPSDQGERRRQGGFGAYAHSRPVHKGKGTVRKKDKS